jgi:hypothetical protein
MGVIMIRTVKIFLNDADEYTFSLDNLKITVVKQGPPGSEHQGPRHYVTHESPENKDDKTAETVERPTDPEPKAPIRAKRARENEA